MGEHTGCPVQCKRKVPYKVKLTVSEIAKELLNYFKINSPNKVLAYVYNLDYIVDNNIENEILISTKYSAKIKDYIDSIKNTCAGLVIGDRAFNLNERYNYVYDLSDMWKNLTGLPFVFAVWIANKKINEEFVNHFNDAIQFGLDNIKNALLNFPDSYVFCEDPEDYLNNKIEYILDDKKSESIHLFFEKMNQI